MPRSPLESQFVIRVGDLSDGASLQDLGPNGFSLGTDNTPGETNHEECLYTVVLRSFLHSFSQ